MAPAALFCLHQPEELLALLAPDVLVAYVLLAAALEGGCHATAAERAPDYIVPSDVVDILANLSQAAERLRRKIRADAAHDVVR
mmetsp:Transcript_20295/g.52394  ORF Transcript_20295/g.52394 Transcript_20295/m.52394 type:complete len:84 (-) Transcript_20295:129-380(-)